MAYFCRGIKMDWFELNDYREIIRAHISQLPKGGRGELARFANHLNVNSTLVSQIMSGTRDLTFEQAMSLTQFMGFNELEIEYFLLLVQLEKAGTQLLKNFFKSKIEELRKKSRKVENRYEHDRKLSDEQKSIFYSSWLYSAIRLFTSIGENGQSLPEICDRFSMDRTRVVGILQFLEKSGLCTIENGRYKMAVQNTFLEKDSPHQLKHHSNWRVKAIELSETLDANELMFTSPISISKSDFGMLREDILKLLNKVSKVVKDSPAENVACLNIDFFWVTK